MSANQLSSVIRTFHPDPIGTIKVTHRTGLCSSVSLWMIVLVVGRIILF